MNWSNIYPCLDDKTSSTYFEGHYTYHPAWAARVVKKIAPKVHVDISSTLHFCSSIRSLSCMHTVEHIGLGRYGNPIDPVADLKAMQELKRVVAQGGNLIIVVPVGRPKMAFNAHRIYSYQQICSYFGPFTLKEFSLVPDNYLETGMIINASQIDVDQQDWGCGCFWFVK